MLRIMLWRVKIAGILVLYTMAYIFMIAFRPKIFKRSQLVDSSWVNNGRLKFNNILNYTEIMSALSELVKLAPGVAISLPLGRTSRGQSIMALELKTQPNITKPRIFITAALDGEDVAAPIAALQIVWHLLFDPSYRHPYLTEYNWHIVPLVDPDGFEQSLDGNPSSNCHVLVDRNFGFHWKEGLSKSKTGCDIVQPGKHPFSTSGAIALRSYTERILPPNLVLQLHSTPLRYMESIAYPWSFSDRPPERATMLQNVADFATKNLHHRTAPYVSTFKVYQLSSQDIVGGTFADHMLGVVGSELVYLLRPFLSPAFHQHELETYVHKSVSAVFGVLRGWRKLSGSNVIRIFGEEMEY